MTTPDKEREEYTFCSACHFQAIGMLEAHKAIIAERDAEIQRLESLLKEREELIKKLEMSDNAKDIRIIELYNQLARFKDCVPVPVDAYDYAARWLKTNTGVSNVMRDVFLSVKEGK
jgi:hypothetical protein